MRKILMIGHFNSISQNIYRSLLNRFCVQFCPPEEELLDEMYPFMMPEVVLVILVGMSEEERAVFACLEKQQSSAPVICVGNNEELGRFEEELSKQQIVQLVRPVTIREIIDSIFRVLHIGSAGSTFMLEDPDRRKRILLIDDSAVQLRTLRDVLKGSYDVDMAKSGQEAMKLIRKNVPDMIFLDYDMPGCDGRMTFEMLKKDSISSDIPVVFLTGVGEKQKVLSVLSMYPADYLLKPVDQKKIMETIDNVIGR